MRESPATRQLYGLDEKETSGFPKSCLLARRLLERGVRFVQVFHGGAGKDWDAHGDLRGNHSWMAAKYDQPAAAWLKDLDARSSSRLLHLLDGWSRLETRTRVRSVA